MSIYSTLEVVRSFRTSFSEESKEQGQQEADNDTGHEGKVKGEPFPLDNDIAGKLPDPGDLIPQGQDKPYSHQYYTRYDQGLA